MTRSRHILIAFAVMLAVLAPALAMDPEEQLQFADGLYVRNMHEMAVREYMIIARDFPEFSKADVVLFRIAESYRHLGEKQTADRFYFRLVTEHPSSAHAPSAKFRRAEFQLEQSRHSEAAAMLRDLVDSKPPSPIAGAAAYYLGYSLEKQGKPGQAEKAFRVVVDSHVDSPFYSYACLSLAAIAREAGKQDEAEQLLRKAAETAAGDRVAAEAIFQLGDLAFAAGDFAGSSKLYSQLLSKYPDDKRAAEAKLQAAWSHYNSGNPQEALALAAGATSGEKRDQWLYLKANAERGAQQPAKALESYGALLAGCPGSSLVAAASYEKALVHFGLGEYEAAMKQAAALPPAAGAEQDVYWIIAESASKLNRADEAIEHYRLVVKHDSKSEKAALARHAIGRLLQESDRLAEASVAYRDMAAGHPSHELAAPSILLSGYCRSKLSQQEEALADWSLLMTSYPKFERIDEVMYQRALAEIQLGSDEAAVDTLKGMLKAHPQSEALPEAAYALGLLHEKGGNAEAADKAFRAGLDAGASGALKEKTEFRLAAVLQKQGRQDEAAQLLQGLIGTSMSAEMSVELLEWLARHQLEQGRFKQAVEAAVALAERAEGEQGAQTGWTLAGQAYTALGRTKEARNAFERAVACPVWTVEGTEAALQLGELALDSGKFQQAEDLFQRAAEHASDEGLIAARARSYYGLARASAGRDQWDSAARYFMSVAVLFDDETLTPQALLRAADAFNKLGREKERDQALEELRTRYPESAQTTESAGDQTGEER